MSFGSFEARSQAPTAEDEAISGRAEVCLLLHVTNSQLPVGKGEEQGRLTDGHTQIEREIAKLKEDSATDVQRQLEQQRSAARKEEVEEVRSSGCGSTLFG
jgi:hypothetical protein